MQVHHMIMIITRCDGRIVRMRVLRRRTRLILLMIRPMRMRRFMRMHMMKAVGIIGAKRLQLLLLLLLLLLLMVHVHLRLNLSRYSFSTSGECLSELLNISE